MVLEHATTRAAIKTVKSLGDTVACTITAHHLALTVDDWAGQGWNYCKPVAKFPDDREALRKVVLEGAISHIMITALCSSLTSGHPRFFLGSDSAPHPPQTKSTTSPEKGCAAGIYTSPILLPLVAHLLESFGALDKLSGFVCTFGRAFYKVEGPRGVGEIILRKIDKEAYVVPECLESGGLTVVPFWAGKKLGWRIETKD